MERAYQEVIEGIAGAATPQNVVAFRLSEAAKARVEWSFARVGFPKSHSAKTDKIAL